MESLRSKLLIASPKLPDDNFFRSVVFMIQHDDEGALGVILNRPTDFRLREVWHAITSTLSPTDSPIYRGGPVENQLIAIHDQEACAEDEVMSGVYLSTQKSSLELLLAAPNKNMRIFFGYAGWSSNQLESELSTGSWLVANAKPDHIFGDPDSLWESVAGEIGNQVLFGNTTPENARGESLNDGSESYPNPSALNDSFFESNASRIWLN